MTVDPAKLLQMLEPAVRPGAATTGGVQQSRPAFENRSFKDLLSEASLGTDDATQMGEQADEQKPHNPLASLGGFEQIENAALRKVLGRNQ